MPSVVYVLSYGIYTFSTDNLLWGLFSYSAYIFHTNMYYAAADYSNQIHRNDSHSIGFFFFFIHFSNQWRYFPCFCCPTQFIVNIWLNLKKRSEYHCCGNETFIGSIRQTVSTISYQMIGERAFNRFDPRIIADELHIPSKDDRYSRSSDSEMIVGILLKLFVGVLGGIQFAELNQLISLDKLWKSSFWVQRSTYVLWNTLHKNAKYCSYQQLCQNSTHLPIHQNRLEKNLIA